VRIVVLGKTYRPAYPWPRPRLISAVSRSFSWTHCGIAMQNDRETPAGRTARWVLEDPLEFQERLLIEDNVVQVGRPQAASPEAVVDRVAREPVVVLDAGKRSSWAAATTRPVDDQRGRGVLVVADRPRIAFVFGTAARVCHGARPVSTFFRRGAEKKARMPKHPGPFAKSLFHPGHCRPRARLRSSNAARRVGRPNFVLVPRSEAAPVF